MRNIQFAEGNFYHVYNRGVDKRRIFKDHYDLERFLQSMDEFNTLSPIGSIYENSFRKKEQEKAGNENPELGSLASKLVDFVAYCVNPNHFHFILRANTDKGVQQFMQRLGTGHTKYFNERHKRTGSLFQGTYKAKHVDNDGYLLHLSAHVNLNFKVHQLDSEALEFSRSSWPEYVGTSKTNFCTKEVILDQFENIKQYETYAKEELKISLENKASQKDEGIYLEA